MTSFTDHCYKHLYYEMIKSRAWIIVGGGVISGFQIQTHPPLKNSNLLNSHSKLTENSPGLRPPQAHWQTQLFLPLPPPWINFLDPLMHMNNLHVYIHVSFVCLLYHRLNDSSRYKLRHLICLLLTSTIKQLADTLYVNLNDVIQKNLLAATQIKIFIHHLSIFFN